MNVVLRISALCLAQLLASCAAPLRFTSSYCTLPARERPAGLTLGARLPEPATRLEQLAALLGLREALEQSRSGPLDGAQRLNALERLDLARLEVGAIKAEADCEGERTKQALDYLMQRRERIVQGLTVASILTASAVAVAGVVLAVRDASAATQVGVGAAGATVVAGTSLESLYVRPTVLLRHEQNLLTDIWNGPPQSSRYPPIVWAYLTYPIFSNEGGASTREKLIQRFCAAGGGCADAARRALIFGEGGDFDVETLRMRAALLD
ncbi:MAG: hypothetical protein JWN48_5414, partial [Myxococcaceae bacterium]|nr:hypothetical protein [Myxococcaceae bacterium]